MGQTFPCDICHEVAADFAVSDVHSGDVHYVGVECLLDWALPVVEAFQAAVAREGVTRDGETLGADVEDKAWEASANPPPKTGTADQADQASDITEPDPETPEAADVQS